MTKTEWITYIKVLVITALFASIGNWISTIRAGTGNIVTPFAALPGLLLLLFITLAGLVIYNLLNKVFGKKNLPAIAYISLIAIIMTIPGFPGAEFTASSINKIGLLPLCTPILAYAGISLGKDLDTFKKQGVAIVLVSLFAFVGTFIGSAIIAQIILKLTGVI
ncbi:MAG: hypothetical protein IJ120_06930 [Solobacterium sp.]|nr:hypothetical protein [Solobacterium sp.]